MRPRLVADLSRMLAFVLAVLLAACASQRPPQEPPDLASVAPGGADPGVDLYRGLGTQEIRLAEAAIQDALERNPSLSPGSWRSEATGRGGTVTPVLTFRATQGSFCREFDETLALPTETRSARRLACRAGDGHWRPATLDDSL